MKRNEGTPRSYGVLAGEFRALAGEYRRVSACIASVGRLCEEAGVQHDQVLAISFTHVVSYVDDAAVQLEQVASRLAGGATSDVPETPDSETEGRAIEHDVVAVESFEDASMELRRAALALEAAMEKALDLVDEVDDGGLTGDSHPFGHVIQGICVPYVLLAAGTLDGLAVQSSNATQV